MHRRTNLDELTNACSSIMDLIESVLILSAPNSPFSATFCLGPKMQKFQGAIWGTKTRNFFE